MWLSRVLLILSSWLAVAITTRTIANELQCSRYCKENSNDFGYENGWVYTYTYSANVTTFINSSSEAQIPNKNVVSLSAVVDIHTLSTCDYKLQISEAQILTINGGGSVEKIPGDLDERLAKNVLHFSFHNGKINTICSVVDEETETLNIKKAILSAFQNSKQNLHQSSILYETDVSGICETEYEIIDYEEGSDYVIKKIKNLDACSHRSEKYFSWQSEPYNKKQANSSPLLRSTQNCLQTYASDMVLKSATCHERHLFQPFSHEDNGAVTELKQDLKFILKKPAHLQTIFPFEFHRSNLLYKKVERTTKRIEDVGEILKRFELLELNDGDVSRVFFELVNMLENVGEEGLADVFDSIRTSEKKKKLFVDAMSLVTTVDGVEIMKKLKIDDVLTQAEFESWIGSLIFIKNPTLDILEALTPLLTTSTLTNQKSVLTVSGLLHRYCKANQCRHSEEVAKIVGLLEEPLKKRCSSVDLVSQESILLALKAIGNVGMTTSYQRLRNCFSKTDAPVDIRLAAIAAHRRINCAQNENVEYFQSMFADVEENTEIRIASYLALMQCSSYAVFTNVKNMLYKEEINQVASFVWTHLTNLQETACQWKLKLKHLLENEFLKNKFNTDMRKYSRNYEMSHFFDAISAGLSVESNVVFTSESYLPKSGMLNLTLDLFGETVNIFEVGARLTGFEEVVEELFGPDGFLREDSMKTLLENARSEHEVMNKIHELGDSVRSQSTLRKEPSGLLYAKVFGNELAYAHFKNFGDIFGERFSARDGFDLLKKLFHKNDVEYTKTFRFLDSTYTIPTLVGLPLEVSVNGTATVGLTVKGKIDVQDFWKQKIQVEGKIYPSAIVEVVGAMTVDVSSTKTGLKSVSIANSNTYVDGHILIDGGKLIDLKLNVPKKQMDIIDVQSDLFLFQNDNATLIEDVTSNVENWEGCTQAIFEKITGLQFCSKYSYVNASQEKFAPYFPMTGSFKYSVNAKRVDDFDGYHLRWSSNLEPETDLNFASLYFDTPNSQVKRKFNASIYLDKKGKRLEAKLEHPFAAMELLCWIESGLNFKILYNNREIIFFESLLHVFQNEYKFDATLNYMEKALAKFSGTLSNNNNVYAMYFTVNDAKVNLVIIPKSGKYAISSEVYSMLFQGTLNATIAVSSDLVSISSRCFYTYKGKRDDVSFNFNVGKIRKIEVVKGGIHLDLKSTLNPFYNTLISFSTERSEMYFENIGIVELFGVTWNTRQLLKFRQPKEYLDVALLCTLNCPQKNIDYQINLAHNSSKVDFNAHVLLQLNRIQRLEVLVKHEKITDDQLVRLFIYYPKHAWSLDGELKKIRADEFDVKLKGQEEIDDVAHEFLNVQGKYRNITREQLRNYTLNVAIDFVENQYFWKSPWTINSSLQLSNDIFISSASLHSKDFRYSVRLTQMTDTFITEVQLDNRKLLVINGKKIGDETSVTLGLNIYQNFEFNIRLKPYTHLDLKFYWDKDRDVSKKIFLAINGNNNGYYLVNLEYPNQKVVASFTLLPTQVTLNVTWGLPVSQKIFLKLGNKIYDVGGTWFGELETPFKYFEKQKFRLKYLVLQQNLETETNISWRDHKINLTATGSKSPSSLTGFLEINSTLPQIRKLGAALSHTFSAAESTTESRTRASLVYNQHQVAAESIWSSRGLDVISTFQVTSSSDTIKPVYGELVISNNETSNYFNCVFSWQGSNVSAEYKFENSRSYVIVKTPFKGVEKTKLEYALVRSPNELVVEIEVNVLEQVNYVSFNWKDRNNSMSDVFFEIISPMTGIYQLYLKHSTLFGYLEEDLIVKQGKDNDIILALQIRGNINSISNVDAKLSVNALGHSISINVFNTHLSSTIEAKWDENSLVSNLQFKATREEITRVIWNVNCTLFTDSIKFQYYHINSQFYFLLSTPNGYKMENNLHLEYPYDRVQNNFRFLTPASKGGFVYEHVYKQLFFNNSLQMYLDEARMDYSAHLMFLEYTYLPRELNLEVVTTWHDPIQLSYALVEDIYVINQINLNFLLKWNNETNYEINSFVKYDLSNNTLTTHVSGNHIDDIDIEGTYNMNRHLLEVRMKVKNVTCYANVVWHEVYSVYAHVKSEDQLQFVVDVKFESPKLEVKAIVPKYQFQADVRVDTEHLVINGGFNVAPPNSNYYALSMNLGGAEGFLYFKRDLKYLTVAYSAKSTTVRNLDIAFKIASTFDAVHNATVMAKTNPNYVDILLEANLEKYSLRLHSSFALDVTTRSALAKGQFESKLVIESNELVNLFLRTGIEMVTLDESTLLTASVESEGWLLNFTGYADLIGLQRADLSVTNEDRACVVQYENLKGDVTFVGTIESAVTKLTCEVDLKRRLLDKHSSEVQTYLTVTKNDDVLYNVELFTQYHNVLRSESRINLTSPDWDYEGFAVLNFNGHQNVLNASLGNSARRNYLVLNLDSYGPRKLNASLLLELDVIELLPIQLLIDIDAQSDAKELTLEYFPDLSTPSNIKLDCRLNKTDLGASLDLPGKKNYLTVSGTYFVEGDEVSIKFNADLNSTKIRGEIFHTAQDFAQTKIDISTTIRGWEKTLFESKIDSDKARMFFALKNNHLSVVANKAALFNGQEVLSVQYNGEQLLMIWSGHDQSYLITSTSYIKYRLGIQYVTDPRIYAFSILKEGENLISFIVQNTSNSNYVNFKGKLIAPILSPRCSNLSLNLHADHDPSRTFEFTLHDQSDNLLEIKWLNKNVDKEYVNYFKFQSKLPMLQLLEVDSHVATETDVAIKSKIVFVQYGDLREFDNQIFVPIVSREVILRSSYPCDEYGRCNFHLEVNKSLVYFHWTSPIDNWKNISFKASLELKGDSLKNELFFERNLRAFDSKLEILSNATGFEWNFNTSSNLADDLKDAAFVGRYLFERRLNMEVASGFWGLGCDLESRDDVRRARFTYVHRDAKTYVTSSIGRNKFDLVLSYDFNELKDVIVGNFTVARTKQELRSQAFDFFFNDFRHGFFAYDFRRAYEFSGFLKNSFGDVLILDGHFRREKGELRMIEYSFPCQLLLSYDVAANVNATFMLAVRNDTVAHVSVLHSSSDNSVDSTVAIRSYEIDDIELDLKYLKQRGSVRGFLRLSSSPSSEVSVKTKLEFTDDRYNFENILTWPRDQSITVIGEAVFEVDQKIIDIDVSTPYTEPLKTLWKYDNIDSDINLLSTIAVGKEKVTAATKLILTKSLSINVTSPFVGYTTGSLLAVFDEINRTAYFRVERENLLAEFEGKATKLENNIDEIRMTAKSLAESFAVVQMKLDRDSMKLSADVTWKNENALLDFSYDPKDLYLSLNSTTDYLRNARLSGTYSKNENTYYLESRGHWNSLNVIISGDLHVLSNKLKINSELKAGDTYEGKFDLECRTSELFEIRAYFPRRSSEVHLKFQSVEREQIDVIIKTPFETFGSLLLELDVAERKINSAISANLIGNEFTGFLKLARGEGETTTAKLGFSIPQDGQALNLELEVDCYRSGFLKIENSRETTFGYNASDYFEISFAQSTQKKLERKIYLLYRGDDVRFDLYDDFDLVAIKKSAIGFWAKLDLPNAVDNSSEPIFTASVDLVEREANATVFQASIRADWDDSSGRIDLINVLSAKTTAKYKANGDGFDVLIDGVNFAETSVTYVNNADEFFFGIEQDNEDRNISAIYELQFWKTLEKFKVRANENFLIDLQASKNLTKMHFFNNHPIIGDFVKCEIDVTGSLFSFLFQTYSLVDVNVLTVIDMADKKKLQFQYGGLKANVLEGIIEVENMGEADTLKIVLSKLKKEVLSLAYDISENSYATSFCVDAFGSLHRSNFQFVKSPPYSIQFEVSSPVLSNEGFAVYGNAPNMSSVSFFVGKKMPVWPYPPGDQYLLLTGKFQQKSILVRLELPKYDLVRLLHYETNWSYDIYRTCNEIQITSSILGNVSVVADFILADDQLDLQAHLRLPFLENFERFDSEFHVGKNMNPSFLIHLPNNKTYSARVNYINEDERILIDGGIIWEDLNTMMTFDFNKSGPSLVAEVYLPLGDHRHYAVAIEKNGTSYHASANLNERVNRVEFDYHSDFIKFELDTPFENHERYRLRVKKKCDSQTQILTCLLFYPGLDREIGFDFVHHLNYSLNYTVSLPVSVYSFRRASFSANLSKGPEYYLINAAGDVNSFNANVSLFLGGSAGESKMDFKLETSENNSIFILVSDKSDVFNTSVTSNGNVILKLDYSYARDDLHFFCDATWKSVKFDYENRGLKQFNASAKIWDADRQYGGHLISTDRVSIGLYLPNRIITMDELYFTNETHDCYFLRFAWSKDDAFGIKITFFNVSEDLSIHVNTLIDLEFPFRSFSLYYDFKLVESLDVINHFVLRWDDANQIDWSSTFVSNKLQSKLSTTALDHDVVLTVDFFKLNKIPSLFKLEIEYSPDVDKLIEVELYYDKNYQGDVSTVERNFVVRQPASKIDYAVNSKTIRTKEFANLTVFLTYTDYILDKPDSIKVSLAIGLTNFEIAGIVETKRNSLNIFTKSNAGAYYKGLEIEMKVNDKEPLNLNYVYNFKDVSPSFTMTMGYGQDRQYRMYAGLPSKREIKAELVHNIFGNGYVDCLFTLKLNTSSLLWVKILWTDQFVGQFSKAIISEYGDLKFVVEATGRQLIDVIDKDFGKALVADERELRNKIISYGHDQKKKIINDYQDFIEGLKETCDDETVFHCRAFQQLKTHWEEHNALKELVEPILEMITKFYENILTVIQQTYGSVLYIFNEIEQALIRLEDVQKLKDNAKELLKKSINDARKSIRDMEILSVELLYDLEEYINVAKSKSEDLFDPLLSLLDDFVAYFESKLAFVQIIVLDTFDTIQQYIQKLEETKKLMETYRALVSWLKNLHLMIVVESVSDFVEAILSTVLNDTKLMVDDYRPYVDTVYATIYGDYQEVTKFPQFGDVKEFINNVYQKTIWVWNYHNVIGNLKAYIHRLSSSLVNYLNVFANEYTGNNDQENIFGQFDYTFRPDLGVIEISQPLPVEWESFDKAPSFEQYPLYQQIHNKIDLIAHSRFDVYKNAIKTYVHYVTRRVFSPSVNNFAMIIGNSHFVTFNNNHFDFIGNCSYLLASDFHSKSFSLVINYAEQNGVYKRRSLSFVNFDTKIDVSPDFTVTLNGGEVDLPLVVDDFIVTRENENILVEHRKGLLVSCDFYFDYCTVEMSEWLFGRTSGFLGTLDNEKFTDSTTSSGYRADTVEEFIDSWKLDGASCDSTNHANDTLDVTGSHLVNKLFNTLCAKIFLDKKSLLSPCFAIVDSKPFYEMCLVDIRDRIKPTVCSATAAYRRQCQNQFVDVSIPNICSSCQSHDGNTDLASPEVIYDGHNPKSVDVVFIQELDCLKNVIANLPKKLNAALVGMGYAKNKFSVVGYGGESAMRPHVYTFERKIWNDENMKVNTTTRVFKWKSKGRYSAADAIKYASEMHFRPALRKMFVLIQCELCSEMDNSPEIYSMLGDRDITLHVLKQKPFEGSDTEIFAIDGYNRFLSGEGSSKNTTSNEIIDQLKDMCSGLALSTGGTLANADFLRRNKHLKSNWATFVASSAKESSCQKCRCVPSPNGVGKVDCTRCMSPIVKQLLNEYDSHGMSF